MTFHASADAGSNDKDFDPAPRPQRSNGPTRPTAARQQAAPCPSCVPCIQCQVGGVDIYSNIGCLKKTEFYQIEHLQICHEYHKYFFPTGSFISKCSIW